MKTHMCASVRGMLRKSNRELHRVMTNDDGRELSGKEAREALMEELAQGHEVIPVGPICAGFDYKTGCPGHREDDEA